MYVCTHIFWNVHAEIHKLRWIYCIIPYAITITITSYINIVHVRNKQPSSSLRELRNNNKNMCWAMNTPSMTINCTRTPLVKNIVFTLVCHCLLSQSFSLSVSRFPSALCIWKKSCCRCSNFHYNTGINGSNNIKSYKQQQQQTCSYYWMFNK